ncbi:MAG: prolipoprotein diacylglyceryl transferase family protein, partial [Bradymonadaceae bacterium]
MALEADDRDNWIQTTAVFGAAGLAALVGARLLWAVGLPTGPLAGPLNWSAIVDPQVPGFWSIGGFVGGGTVAVAAARQVGDDGGPAILDRVVPAGLWALAISRLGCLSAGCDFGRPTDGAWGIRYPAGTPAWEAHLARDLVGPEATVSAPTHPFPLYMVAIGLAAIGLGTALQRWSPTEREPLRAGERAIA